MSPREANPAVPNCVVLPPCTQLLRFDQPVAQVPVGTKAALDAVFAFDPADWAADYNGTWENTLTLLVTVVDVPAASRASSSLRSRTDVGRLRLMVRAAGGLTSLDGTSAPSTASTVLADGSWGGVVCDGALFVYSATAVVATFTPPVTAGYTPATYTISVSTSLAFKPNDVVISVNASDSATGLVGPASISSASSMRFVVPHLDPGVPVYMRVAASVPLLPDVVSRDLPRAVLPVGWPLGGPGGCTCTNATSASGCSSDGHGVSQSLAPAGPLIGEDWLSLAASTCLASSNRGIGAHLGSLFGC
jgi:hypothetical protein